MSDASNGALAPASALPPTRMQDAAPGANELVAAYTDRFAAVVADWWQSIEI